MNGREAVKALMDGKLVVREGGEFIYSLTGKSIRNQHGDAFSIETILGRDDWSIAETPLTDEQLIAEWESCAKSVRREGGEGGEAAAMAYEACASQLRERKL